MSYSAKTETPIERKRRLWREASLRWLQRHPEYKADPDRKRQNFRRYYVKNKSKICSKTTAYQKLHRDKTKIYRTRWSAKNKDYHPLWRNKNPNAARVASERWQAKNPHRRRQISQAYRARNPDYIVRCNAKRRSRTGLDSQFDPLIDAMVKNVRARSAIECAYCMKRIQEFHIDHIVPLSRGGLNLIENLCVACVPCNLSKGSKLLSEWKWPKKCV